MTQHQPRILIAITRLVLGGAQESVLVTADHLIHRPQYAEKYAVEVASGPDLGTEGELQTDIRNRHIPLTIIPGLGNPIRPHKDGQAFVHMYRHMRRNRYTIVHTHSTKAGLIGRMAAKLARVPIIIHTVHGWGFSAQIGGTQQHVLVPMERAAARFTDRLITVTHLDTEKGLALHIGRPEQYVTIRSGIDLDQFGCVPQAAASIRHELGIPADAPVIGTVGRMSPQKAPLDFVKMARAVVDTVPNAYFVLVGDGPLHEDVERAVAAEGLSGQFILTGLRRDVPELMSAFDIFALTSLWEGLPRVLPQAMATGLPMVATAADGSAEVIKHGTNGFLTDPGAVTDLANYVVRLINDPALAKQLGAHGKSEVAEYSDHLMVEQTANLYEELLIKKGFR